MSDILTPLFDRLEKSAQALYWAGYQNGITHGILLVLVVWVVSWYVRSK